MSPRFPRVTPRRVERILLRAGWVLRRVKGSHHHYKHPDKPELLVTIPFHAKTLPPGLLGKIAKDASLTPDEFRELL